METSTKISNIRLFFFEEYKKPEVADYWCGKFGLGKSKVTDVYKNLTEDDKDFLRYALANSLAAYGEESYAAYRSDADAKAAEKAAKAAEKAAKSAAKAAAKTATTSKDSKPAETSATVNSDESAPSADE